MRNVEHINKNIKLILEQKGVDTVAFAEELEVEPALVEAWISGAELPSLEILPTIAEALSLSIDDLFRENLEPEEAESHSASEKSIIYAEDERDPNRIDLINEIKNVDLILDGSNKVVIRESEDGRSRLHVYGDDDFRDAVSFSEDEDTLKLKVMSGVEKGTFLGISFDFSSSGSNNLVIVELPAEVEKVVRASISGAPELEIETNLEKLEFEISGSADVKADQVTDFISKIYGSADIEVDKVDNFDLDILGSGDVKINYARGNGNVRIQGSGNVELGDSVMEDLDISISGSGDFKSDVSVNNVVANVIGSGDIIVREIRGERSFHNLAEENFTVKSE